MKNIFKYKKILVIVAGLIVLVCILLAMTGGKRTTTTAPFKDDTDVGGTESVIPAVSNIKPGDNLKEVQSTNQELRNVNQQTTGTGYTMNYVIDKTIDRLVTNSEGKIVAIFKYPEYGVDDYTSSAKVKYSLAKPTETLYVSNAVGVKIDVYPNKGIAYTYNEYTQNVQEILVFKPTTLNEFLMYFGKMYTYEVYKGN